MPERIRPFLSDIDPACTEMIQALHEQLTKEYGFEVKLQAAKSGHVVSYLYGGKTILNFVARRTGPQVRIYGDHSPQYQDAINALPEAVKKKILKAGDCKRMLDPNKCNQKCSMGYVFTLDGTECKKCRYNCFLFPITPENSAGIRELVGREMALRGA